LEHVSDLSRPSNTLHLCICRDHCCTHVIKFEVGCVAAHTSTSTSTQALVALLHALVRQQTGCVAHAAGGLDRCTSRRQLPSFPSNTRTSPCGALFKITVPFATWKPPARMIKYPKPRARRSSAGGGREQPAAWLGPKTAQVLCFTVSRTLSRPPSPATRRVAAPVTRSKRRPTGCKYVWSRPPQRLPLGDGLDGLVDRRVVARRRVAAGRRGLLRVLRRCAGAGRLRHACTVRDASLL